jgi:hypothetical protein
MGSKAAPQVGLPGPPVQSELAYLAGLLDRGGMVASRSIGLKIEGPPPLLAWLRSCFGGSISSGTWWLTRQADLLFILPRVEPHLRVKKLRCRTLCRLVAHCHNRASYHGDPEWRAERDRLRQLVATAG